VKRLILVLLVALAVIVAVPAEGARKKSGNQGQVYRLPWLEGATSYD